jgi:hypothetical protein
MKYDVEIYFQEDKLDWSYGSNDYYLYPLRFKEPIANCREVSFDYKVSSDSRLWGTWRVYYRCDGKWVHKDDVKIKESGAEVTVVTKFDSKPKVSGVFLIPLNTPNSEYKWDESFRVNYVQSGE